MDCGRKDSELNLWKIIHSSAVSGPRSELIFMNSQFLILPYIIHSTLESYSLYILMLENYFYTENNFEYSLQMLYLTHLGIV